MKYLNLGCGSHFSNAEEWTNVNFQKTGEHVIVHNLINGIPFSYNSFDLVYHSHIIEHFSKKDGQKLVQECYRVLKPGGIIRIALPDLEQIIRHYLQFLEKGISNPKDMQNQANYNWIMLELFDQVTRNSTGGLMAEYLAQDSIVNEDFLYKRIGNELKQIRDYIVLMKKNSIKQKTANTSNLKGFWNKLLNKKQETEFETIGKFHLGGEIHQWMYDRFSISLLLEECLFNNIKIQTAFTSNIDEWKKYELDSIGDEVRKPDSLFIEAIK